MIRWGKTLETLLLSFQKDWVEVLGREISLPIEIAYCIQQSNAIPILLFFNIKIQEIWVKTYPFSSIQFKTDGYTLSFYIFKLKLRNLFRNIIFL